MEERIPLTALDAPGTAKTLRRFFDDSLTIDVAEAGNALILRGTKQQLQDAKSVFMYRTGPVQKRPVIQRIDAALLADTLQSLLPRICANPVSVIGPAHAGFATDGKGPEIRLIAMGGLLIVECEDRAALTIVQELIRVLTAGRTAAKR